MVKKHKRARTKREDIKETIRVLLFGMKPGSRDVLQKEKVLYKDSLIGS